MGTTSRALNGSPAVAGETNMGIREFRQKGAIGAASLVLAAIASGVVPDATGAQAAETNAVVLMYHRFGESEYPTTNVTLEQFEAHIEELSKPRYNVMGLPEIVAAVRAGQPLPERTVGLSVDDAYVSVLQEAWPRLKAAGLPLTLFVSTGPVDDGLGGILSWDQIRQMRDEGLTIGAHTVSHAHLPRLGPAARQREIAQSNARFEAELGQVPALFAYPYGEASLDIMAEAEAAGYTAAFGQHSGVIGSTGNLFYLPRFALNETYGSIDRLQLAANALPLPVSDLTPADPLIGASNPPLIGFTVDASVDGLDRLSCYASNEGKVAIERLGQRVEVRPTQAFPTGRTRVNCTMPEVGGRWRWFGRQYYNAP